MYEHRKARPLSRGDFIRRVLLHGAISAGLISAALTIGVCGYHFLGELGWLDSLVNASMILGGMGPVDPISPVSGKLFASGYALFSGIVFIAVMGVLLAPFGHRLMHQFHWADPEDEG